MIGGLGRFTPLAGGIPPVAEIYSPTNSAYLPYPVSCLPPVRGYPLPVSSLGLVGWNVPINPDKPPGGFLPYPSVLPSTETAATCPLFGQFGDAWGVADTQASAPPHPYSD